MTPANPRTLITYSHDTPEHAARVLDFAERLRDDGVDARLDVYEPAPRQGWPRWLQDEIDSADYVLVVCTELYHQRFQGRDAPTPDRESRWQSVLNDELYTTGVEVTTFIPVVFSDEDGAHTPAVLSGATCYHVATPEGYEDLYRRLTDQPPARAPGALQKLPPRVRRRRICDPPETELALLPFPPNPFFRGRTEILSSLPGRLAQDGRSALTGPSGSGKTATAVHFAYLYQRSYTALFFTRAGSEAELIDGFIAIARTLGLPEAEELEPGAVAAAVKRWYESHDGWLLIVDSVTEPGLVEPFLPATGRGHLLVTSQSPQLAALGIPEPLPLPPFTPEEALAYILERAERSSYEAAERRAAAMLAVELGHQPLALDLAAAYLGEHGDRLYNYLPIFRQRGRELTARGVPQVEGHPDPVTTQCSLTFEAVASTSTATADLLCTCALLAPEDVPDELLLYGSTALGRALAEEVDDDIESVNDVLWPALRYSLAQRGTQGTWSIHRRVHAAIREQLLKNRDRWSQRVVKALHRAWSKADQLQRDRLLKHVIAAAGSAKDSANLVKLLQAAGQHLCDRARYDEAERLLARALATPVRQRKE